MEKIAQKARVRVPGEYLYNEFQSENGVGEEMIKDAESDGVYEYLEPDDGWDTSRTTTPRSEWDEEDEVLEEEEKRKNGQRVCKA